jgi:hypothetical protein
MTRVENVGVFIWEKYKYSNIFKPSHPSYQPPTKMEQTECSKTSAYKIQTTGNYPEESIQYSKHGKSLKLRIKYICFMTGTAIEAIYITASSSRFKFIILCLQFYNACIRAEEIEKL